MPLRAFAILKGDTVTFGDFRLVNVGSAGRTDRLRHETLSELRHLGLEYQVIFVDGVSGESLASYYSSAAALIVPSLY